MNKYVKIDDIEKLITACEWRLTLAKERNGEGFVDYSKQVLDVDELTKRLSNLPTIEVSEENEFKFYYVESIDDYWIGKRLDNFYYAEWRGDYFIWTHSRYLPWGEHVVNDNTLWKEHTYPSEPREIPFTEWIVGFMKKYGSEVSEDCISREWILEEFSKGRENISKSEYFDELVWLVIHAPSVVLAYQPITIKTDEKDSKSLKEQLKDIKTPGILMTEEEYGLFGCRVRTVEHAPSIVPKERIEE